MDYTTINEKSRPMEHLVDLFCFSGRPLNRDPGNPIEVIVNHAYALGFCPNRLQPSWGAYRVAEATSGRGNETVEKWYARPHAFCDDPRLDAWHQVGTGPFSNVDGADGGFDRGHVIPNNAIAKQFGPLAQLETFFMSNISPQAADLNQKYWRAMEENIVGLYAKDIDHIWIITGPIFNTTLGHVVRAERNLRIPIPSHFFVVGVAVDKKERQLVVGLKVSQDVDHAIFDSAHLVPIEEIEQETKLRFFSKKSDGNHRNFITTDMEATWDRLTKDLAPVEENG